MKRYLRPDLMQKAGIENFDDWASNFGEVVTQLEMKPAGDGFRMKKRFAKFANIPELMAMYKEFADIRTPDMVKLPVPLIKGGKPQIVLSQPSEFQKAFVKVLGQRSEAIHNGNVDPSIDNMLKITNEARILGLDSRCINPGAEILPDCKVNKCVDNIIRIYESTAEEKGAQAVFCDIAINDTDGRFSVYSCIKDELISRGIPENEICFASDAKTDEQRAKIYAQLRAGEKRVIIASTTKLGIGANFQDRLAAIHHLDIPWRPSDLEQRNGRGIRQGNMFPEIEILHYTTAETFDTYLLNIVTTKQKFISQVMTSKEPARVCEDVDDMVLTYSEMQAITSGNPLVKEKIELDNDISRLKLLESEYLSQQYSLQDLVNKKLPSDLETYQQVLVKAKQDYELHSKTASDDFSITIDGKNYTERKDAGDVLTKHITKCLVSGESAHNIGEYQGFKLGIEKSVMSGMCTAVLQGNLKYNVDVELDNNIGNCIRIENLKKNGIPAKVESLEQKIEATKADMQSATDALNKPFEHGDELKEKLARIEVVNHELSFDKPEDDTYVDEEIADKATLIKDPCYMKVSEKQLSALSEKEIKFEVKRSNDQIIIKYDKTDEAEIKKASNEQNVSISR